MESNERSKVDTSQEGIKEQPKNQEVEKLQQEKEIEAPLEEKEEEKKEEKKKIPPMKPPVDRVTPKLEKPQRPLIIDMAKVIVVLVTIGIIAGLYILFNMARLQSQAPGITILTFDKYTEGFKPVGVPEGTISLTRKAPGLKEGQGALQYDYKNVADKYVGIGTLRTNPNNFKEIKLKICSKKDRTFAIGLEEIEDGSSYVFVFNLKANRWTEVKATPDAFRLSRGSPDGNNRLDIDSLNNRLMIADMSGYKGEIGENTFWLSSVEIERSAEKK